MDDPRDRLPELPRFRLLDGPSPLAPLPRFSAALGGRAEVWIKREDLLPLAFGGNKLRNLEFHVGAALADGADTLITAGRRWSNHCRLTAAAGARSGLAVHLVLSGPPVSPPGPNERLDVLLGATVEVTSSEDRDERSRAIDAAAARLLAAGRRPYVIPVGGSGMVGAMGQLRGGLELVDQAAAAGVRPSTVVLPTATGGTQAGLLVGIRLGGLATRVDGIAVAQPAAELRPVVERLVAELGAACAATGLTVGADEIAIGDEQLGAGYGQPTAAADEAIRLLARTEGILVDPIYTAKALAGLIAAVRDGRHDGESVVFWHAGGTPGLFEALPG